MFTPEQRNTTANDLLKIAEHLEKMPSRRFNFLKLFNLPKGNRISPTRLPAKRKEWKCGGVGCAIGEFPVIFPKRFKYALDHGVGDGSQMLVFPFKKGILANWHYGFGDVVHDLSKDLNLTTLEFVNLFVPTSAHSYWKTGGFGFTQWRWRPLTDHAKPKELAALLRRAAKGIQKDAKQLLQKLHSA